LEGNKETTIRKAQKGKLAREGRNNPAGYVMVLGKFSPLVGVLDPRLSLEENPKEEGGISMLLGDKEGPATSDACRYFLRPQTGFKFVRPDGTEGSLGKDCRNFYFRPGFKSQ
jgi:hypothetical protein